MYTLDIRELADEWVAEHEDDDETLSWGEVADRDNKYVDLCNELGIDATPDDLRWYGDQEEPTLIEQNSFEEYARELAEDIGAINGDEHWPLTCIDWERAADELAMDYTSVNFDGIDYYIRA